MRDLSADIFNEIQTWNNLHIRGAQIAKRIARFVLSFKFYHHYYCVFFFSLKADNKTYPPELEELCTVLFEAVESLEIIVTNLKSITKKVAALIQLHKSDSPLFITWPVQKFVDTTVQISDAYEIEYKLKR